VNVNYDTKINKATIVDSLEGATNMEWTRNTLRQMSVKSSYVQQITDVSSKPSMKCHFAGQTVNGDGSKETFVTINLESAVLVKSVKMFNINNGAISSNLNNSIIYVGDSSNPGSERSCAKVAPNIPVNKFVSFVCEKDVSKAKNVFST
jgi:hypothetical protein